MSETGNQSPAPPAPPPAKSAAKSSSREEGELSSADEPELPASSIALLENVASAEPVYVSTKQRLSTSSKAGKSLIMSNQALTRRNQQKNFTRNQVAFKFNGKRNFSWKKDNTDDNLVISFSDSDSGSDSGKSESGRSKERKKDEIDKSKMTVNPVQARLSLLQQGAYDGRSQVPKKRIGSHGSILSVEEANKDHSSSLGISLNRKDTVLPRKDTLKSSPSPVHEQVQFDSAGTTSEVLHLQFSLGQKVPDLPKTSGDQGKKRFSCPQGACTEQLSQELPSKGYVSSTPVPDKAVDLAPSHPNKRTKLDEAAEYAQKHPPLHEHTELSKHIGSSSSFGMDNEMVSYRNPKANASKDSYTKRHHEVDENANKQSKVMRTGLHNREILTTNVYRPKSNFNMNAQREGKRVIAGDAASKHAKCDKEVMQMKSSAANEFLGSVQKDSGLERLGALTEFCNVSGNNARDDNYSGDEQRIALQRGKVHPPRTGILTPSNQNGNGKMGNMTLESLLHLEELQDKELEDAQQLRRKCELEERRALKAYRKAQRALFDANERCAILHKKRETVSAELQGLLSKSSASLLPSGWEQSRESLLDSLKITPNASFDGLSKFGLSLPAKEHVLERVDNISNSQYSDEAQRDGPFKQMDGHDPVYNQCSEPDDSTSEFRDKFATKRSRSHVSCANFSTDDDENNMIFDNGYVEPRHIVLTDQRQNGTEGSPVENIDTERLQSNKDSLDYDLEASLRSKLVARLGMRTSKSNNLPETGCQVDKTTKSDCSKPFSVIEQQFDQEVGVPDSAGAAETGKISNDHCNNNDCQGSTYFCKESISAIEPVLPSVVLHNVFTHLKFKFTGYQSRNPTPKYDAYTDDVADAVVTEVKRPCTTSFEAGFSICDLSVDPFWPLCMYELRGKCNDEECCWQHVRSCKKRKNKQDDFLSDHDSDCQLPQALASKRVTNLPERYDGFFLKLLGIPVYYIGSSLIKVDSRLAQSVMARSVWQYWQREFSASFRLPFSVQRFLPSDAPSLRFGDDPVADYDSWNRHLLYFRNQDGLMKKFVQGLPDSEQSLEMALDLFSGEVSKPERRKAFSVLSRALEADPNSEVLWVVYLRLFYRNQDGIGKDDMFYHAVQHNEGSYDLWLMYINSRVHLTDRFDAYNDALTAVCQRIVSCDLEKERRSTHVLDIFLQMIDFLVMSGSLDKFVGRIYELIINAESVSASDSGVSGDKLLSDILCCLTIPDRSIFLISCIYVLVYGLLPKEVANQLELEKNLPFGIQWPVVQLTSDKKSLALRLMELSVGKLASDLDGKLFRRDWNALRSLHFLVISHVKFVAAVDDLQCSLELLFKYWKLYPTCIELVMLSEHFLDNNSGMVPGGFDYALENWPKGSPGIQCLWNQYAEHSLSKSSKDAEALMQRWFQSFSEVSISKSGNLEDSELLSDEDSLCGLHSKLDDDMFKFLNLALFKMLHNDLGEAYLAVDNALKIAASQYYKHCLKEHSVLFLLNESESSQDMPGANVFRLLSNYVGDSRFLHKLETLTRRFLESIKKPRLKQLIDDILGPISIDFSTINSVLEECHGPTLLAENVGLKDLVSFAELVMEMSPANYPFALSVYKFVARNYFSTETGTGSVGTMFWASSLLVNSIFQATPVAPEDIWIEAANLLRNFDIQGICGRFHQQAVSVYPFSVQLWRSYQSLFGSSGSADIVAETARKKGLELYSNPN